VVDKEPDSSFQKSGLPEIGIPQRPRDGPINDEEINKRFKMWLDSVLHYHINQYFDNYFISWIKVLIQVLNNEKVKKLLSYIDDLYLRAGKQQPGIIVGNYLDHTLILNPSNLQAEDDLSKLSDLIKQNPILILAMMMEFDELILYILTNNNISSHLKDCWPHILLRFIEVVREFENDKAVTNFKISEALMSSKKVNGSWPGFLIVKNESMAIYYRWHRVAVHFHDQKVIFSTDTIIEDELEAFSKSTLDAAPYTWFYLPMSMAELKSMLVENNSQSNIFRIK